MIQKSFVEITTQWDTAMSMQDFAGKWKFIGADLAVLEDPDPLLVAMQDAVLWRETTLYVRGLFVEDKVRRMVEGLAYA